MHQGLPRKSISEAMQGNANAYQHGMYGDLIRPDDLPFVATMQARVGAIEDELLIARLQLRRALKAQSHADDLPDAMEVCETIERDRTAKLAGRNEVKRKLREYPTIINALLGRIESLEKTRADLQKNEKAASAASVSAEANDGFIFTVHRTKDAA
jgi:hypothetical protein